MKRCGQFLHLALGAVVLFNFQSTAQAAAGKAKSPGAPRILSSLPPGTNPNRLPPGVRPGQQKGPATPNIIIIVADDLGWGDLGSYGQKLIKTPNLDRLAADGMRFTQAYAGSPQGNASRCALLTGMHSGHGYIRGNREVPLRAADRVIPELLRGTRRYETIALGKWNLGGKGTNGSPFKKGFNHWRGFVNQLHANNHYPNFIWCYEPGHRGVNSWNGDVQIHANNSGRRAVYSTDLLTKAALNTIRIYRPSWETGYRPFFLYLSYTAPHANNELARKTGQGNEVPTDFPYTGERWPRAEKNKAAMITRLDSAVGQIMAKLREYNIDEDTVIFFTSDNGPHQEGGNDPQFFRSAGPFKGIKNSLYEGGLRVPMLVRWTGKVKANSVSNEPFPLWDIMPTVLQIARIPSPREIDGVSIMPTLIGLPQKSRHKYLYWESHYPHSKQAARKGNWKVIRPAAGKALELYDLSVDAGEQLNVAARHPEIIRDFETFLRTARTRSLHWPITMPGQTAATNRR